jgi:hypothetical protein
MRDFCARLRAFNINQHTSQSLPLRICEGSCRALILTIQQESNAWVKRHPSIPKGARTSARSRRRRVTLQPIVRPCATAFAASARLVPPVSHLHSCMIVTRRVEPFNFQLIQWREWRHSFSLQHCLAPAAQVFNARINRARKQHHKRQVSRMKATLFALRLNELLCLSAR